MGEFRPERSQSSPGHRRGSARRSRRRLRRHSAGAAVAVNYLSKADADRVVGEIVKAGGKADAIQADVAKRADLQRLFWETMEKLGRPSILVNNEGVYRMDPLESGDRGGFPSPVQHQRPRRDPCCAGGRQGFQRFGRQHHQLQHDMDHESCAELSGLFRLKERGRRCHTHARY